MQMTSFHSHSYLYKTLSLSLCVFLSLALDYSLFYCPPEQTPIEEDISYLYYTERKVYLNYFAYLTYEHCTQKSHSMDDVPFKKPYKWINFYSYLMQNIVGKYVKDMNIYFTTMSKHKKGIQF